MIKFGPVSQDPSKGKCYSGPNLYLNFDLEIPNMKTFQPEKNF